MKGLKRASHSCFSFLLQISSKAFSVKDYQLIQYLIPVPVSLRPLFDYVLAGKIQHLFQCRIAWEYAFCFRDFPILAVQSFYDIYLSCKKIENDVYNFPTWQYCKYKDIFDSRTIINSTAKFYISISYQKDLLSIDTRIFTPSYKIRCSLWICKFNCDIRDNPI